MQNDHGTLHTNSQPGPVVSIIIPVHNGANYLKEAIESALSQTYKNIEILVINDGSNDNGATEIIAYSYGDRIRYFSKPKGGVASALNMGISQMRGNYFSWLSHDDLYFKEKIERQIKVLSQFDNDRVILYSNYTYFRADPNKEILCVMKGVSPNSFRYWITIENSLHGCTLLIPKSAFEECGVFDEKLLTTQDFDLWFRLSQKYQFIHMPQALVKSRSHSQQCSVIMKDLAVKETNDLLSHFVKQLSEDEISQVALCSVGLGYARLASSMCYRGFFSAGWVSACLSHKHCYKTTPKELFLAHCLVIKGVILHFIVKPVKKIISPYVRLRVKKLAIGFYSSLQKHTRRIG